jgi:hypothetical protein
MASLKCELISSVMIVSKFREKELFLRDFRIYSDGLCSCRIRDKTVKVAA